MNKSERQSYIMQLIDQAEGLLETRELAERFGVSEMTVRRDLQELSREGLLRRQHGGAAPAPQRSQTTPRKEIGIILVSRNGKYSDPFFNAVLEGVDRKLQELGYRVAYINTRAEVSTAEQARALLEETTVNGIILVGPPLGIGSLDYLKTHVRPLVIMVESLGREFDSVTFDGYDGIRQIVDHLVQRGRRRIAFIAGHFDARQQGYMDALQAHGLSADPELCIHVPYGLDGWTRDLGHIGAEQLLRLPKRPDAIVCASDLIAIGAIQRLHQYGLRVPDDMAVTGFDDITESAFTVPPLTTVHVHKQLMGALAAERIVKRFENPEEIPLLIQTPTQLVIRQSS